MLFIVMLFLIGEIVVNVQAMSALKNGTPMGKFPRRFTDFYINWKQKLGAVYYVVFAAWCFFLLVITLADGAFIVSFVVIAYTIVRIQLFNAVKRNAANTPAAV